MHREYASLYSAVLRTFVACLICALLAIAALSVGGTKAQAAEPNGSSSVYATLSVSNSWDSEGAHFSQYDLSVVNGSDTPISSWEIAIDLPAGMEVEQSWNCTESAADGTLSITPADHAEEIQADGRVSGIGLIVKSADSNAKLTTYSLKYVSNGLTHSAGGDGAANAGEKPDSGAGDADSSNPGGSEGTDDGGSGASISVPNGDISPLHVSGTQIVNVSGAPVRLQGLSTHGLAWYPQYVNKAAFQTLRDDWGANVVRLAMYTAEYNGYCTGDAANQKTLEDLVDQGVSYATDLNMYVIIDWHILSDGNPNTYKSQAKAFFSKMAKKYQGHTNVIYEICNEPNGGTSWDQIRTYANEVIPCITQYDSDALIICGTPTWDQDVDQVAANPVNSAYKSNVVYALHFYVGTHRQDIRSKAARALNAGTPLFISECSITDASGNGGVDTNSGNEWLSFIKDSGLSFVEWSLSNKGESSAAIKTNCSATSGWTESQLTETGIWFRNVMRELANKGTWQTIGGKRYYFDGSNRMQTGLIKWNGVGDYTYFGEDGAAQEGFVTVDGATYYFAGADKNYRSQRWSQVIDGKLYYFKGDYTMQTGLIKWNVSGDYSYFGSDGAAVEGLQDVNGATYLFGGSEKNWRSLRWTQYLDGKRFYVDGNYQVKTGLVTWNNDGTTSLFGEDGAMVDAGWAQYQGSWYYVGPATGRLVRWTQYIEGKRYYFNGSFKMQTGLVKWNSTGDYCYFGDDGAAQEGLVVAGGKTYLFAGADGNWLSQRWTWYRGADGTWSKNSGGDRYYFGGDYAMRTGWIHWGGTSRWSCFGSDGVALTGSQTVDGIAYTFDKNGEVER